MTAISGHRSQRGIALLIVLWLSVLLTVLASGLAFDTRSEVFAARNTVLHAQARLRADGAVERALFEMARAQNFPGKWEADGLVHRWREGEAELAVGIADESGRIDINVAPEPLLRSLLANLGGLDDERAAAVAAAIEDWRDADELPRPNGAEEPQYRSAGRSYKPTNLPFESVEELRRVLGVTDEVYARIAGALTVYSGAPGVNSVVAPRAVLLALPNAMPEAVDAFISERQAALASKLPVPIFPPAAPFNAGPVRVWRIRADAALSEGVRFVRDAVIRPAPDPRQMPNVLSWKEGA